MFGNAALSVATTVATSANASTVQTVFVIALENHNFTQPNTLTSLQQLFGNPAAPYFNSLITPGNPHAAMTSYASSYNNLAPQLASSPSGAGAVHPSEPNYIWAEAGQTAPNGVRTDGDPSAANNNILPAGIASLSAELQTKFGATGWKSYQEDSQLNSNGTVESTYTVPLASASGNNGPTNAYNGSTQFDYAPKHDPQVFFSATNGAGSVSHYAPLQQLQTDLNNNTVARYNWITPDQFNDMHTSLTGGFTYNGTHFTGDAANIAQGDNFLSIIVPQIEASAAFQNNGVIVIWNDETEGGDTSAFTGTEILISPLAKGNAFNSTLSYDHSSDLKTWSELFGVAAPGDAANPLVNDLSDLFQPGAITATTVIEPFGATSLVQVGSNYFLDSNSSGTGPKVMIGGAPLTVGEFGWTPIGAEQTSTGYEIALNYTAIGQYTMWYTDTNGNVTYDPIGNVSGTSVALEALEPSFHQDLNGDGVIGVLIGSSSSGSTSLVQVGNHYFLDSNSTGTGPEVMIGGAPLTVGEFGWTPIAGQQTSTGYEIALNYAAIGQYTVWNTDTSGNVTYDPIGNVSGNSTALEASELSFHQDLDGDGVIGIPGTIESFGFTSLVQLGNHYFLDSNSIGTGPEVMIGGAPLTVGEFGWTPIGAEQTSTGYEIALKYAAIGQYTVWNTDTNGNVTYDPIGNVSGTSTALEALEPSFHQDLNGDGVIGIPSTTSPANPASPAPVVTAANNDTFVFGAAAAPKAASMDSLESGGSISYAGMRLAAPLHDAQPQALHDPSNPDQHDSVRMTNFDLADPHAGHFIIS